MAGAGSHHIPEKAICIPCSPPVDISAYLPIVDHPLFQRLRGRKQLGVNFLVFPGAVHTRFEHTVGVLGLTRRFCEIYGVDSATRHLLGAYALLHDIGHGPFSHQIEPVLRGSHKQQGLRCLDRMTDALAACDLTADGMAALFAGNHPLAALVHDRNLGTDKLDYLRRDALHIGFGGTPEIEKVALYSTVEDGVWSIEEKFIEDVKRIQKFYSYLHQHGYLNKTALSVQRVFQRAVQEGLDNHENAHQELWEMTDPQLENWLRQQGGLVQPLMRRLDDRTFHRTVFVIKPKGYGFVERGKARCVTVREWSRERLSRFSTLYADCDRLRDLEDSLAQAVGVDRGALLFAAMPFFDKLIPQDIRVFSASGEREYWLFENDRDHRRSLEGDYLRTFSVRVVVHPELREQVARKAGVINEFLGQICEEA